MYNLNDSINTAYSYIQSLRQKGYKYLGTPVYNVTKDDLLELSKIGEKYDIPFEWLINLIKNETAATFSPSITNNIGATGLIQFLKSTAVSLGTTTDELRKMTFKQQLVYVDKYLKGALKKHLTPEGKIPPTFTQGDVFMTIFYPVSVGKPNYQFPDSVKKANSGISTPLDYVQRALKNSVFPLTIFPYSLAEVKKKFGEVYDKGKQKIKSNWIPITVIVLGLSGLVYYIIKRNK
jgi:hypothetical protein